MLYAAKEDIERLYGSEFLSDLLPTDIEEVEAIDASINEALESASSEIDGHLSARYALPLATKPRVLLRPTIDIANYVLANRQSRLTETIETRYEQAVALLKRIANGQAGLGEDEPKVEGSSGSGGSAFSANPRKFGRGR